MSISQGPISSFPISGLVSTAAVVTPKFGWNVPQDILPLQQGPSLSVDRLPNNTFFGKGTSEFIPTFNVNWQPQHDIKPIFYKAMLDNAYPACPTKTANEFQPSFVTQWLHQSDLRGLPGPRQLDNVGFFKQPSGTPLDFRWWFDTGTLTQLPAWRTVDRAEAPACPTKTANEFQPSFVTQWLHQTDITPRFYRVQLDNPLCPPKAAGQFLGLFTTQWLHQTDITPRYYRAPLENPVPGCPPIVPDEFVGSFVTQWLHQTDLKPLAGPRQLADAPFQSYAPFLTGTPVDFRWWFETGDLPRLMPAFKTVDRAETPACPSVPKGEFLGLFTTQWLHQTDLKPLVGPRQLADAPFQSYAPFLLGTPVDFRWWFNTFDLPQHPRFKTVDRAEVPACPTKTANEFQPSFVTQWLHQTDLKPTFFRITLDNLAPGCPTIQPNEFPRTFVTQWLHQTDLGKLLGPRQLDNAPIFLLAPQATPTPTKWWFETGDIPQLTPRFKTVDRAEAPACPSVPKGMFLKNFVSQWHGQTDLPRLVKPRTFDLEPFFASSATFRQIPYSMRTVLTLDGSPTTSTIMQGGVSTGLTVTGGVTTVTSVPPYDPV